MSFTKCVCADSLVDEGGGDVHVAADIVLVCVNTLYLGGMPPPKERFLNLQPLRLFLVAFETMYTVWYVRNVVGKAT